MFKIALSYSVYLLSDEIFLCLYASFLLSDLLIMGKCNFLNEWLKRTDDNGSLISEWGRRQNNDMFCIVCGNTISVEKGFYAIKQHYKTEKHKNNFASNKRSLQLHLRLDKEDPHPNEGQCSKVSLCLYSDRESALVAELIWCMKTVASDMSAQSCLGVADVFKAMFPSPGAVPEQFSLNPTKLGYLLTEALAPYFRDMFLSEVKSNFFSLQFDETTNNAGHKELQTIVRFWSEPRGEACTRHLESFYMGHSTAEELQANILLAIENGGLCLTKLLMLGSDGPNVNKKVFRLINEKVKSLRVKGLVNIGFCNLHMMHNAFQKGLEELGYDASDLIISLYYYFKDWPSRWEDFNNIQCAKGLHQMQFIKHIRTRWLTIQSAANRVLEQWDAIIEYFLKYIPSKQERFMGTMAYKRIISLLKKKTVKLELMFIKSSSSLFTKFTGMFQKEEPLIHIMYDHIDEVLLAIMGRICKKEIVEHFLKIENEDVFKPENLLLHKDIFFCDTIRSALSPLTKQEKESFLLSVKKHYIAAGNYILKKRKESINLKAFSCLNPKKIKDKESELNVIRLATCLPILVDTENLVDEWKLLQFENLEGPDRIDHFWNKVFQIKIIDRFKYPVLTEVVKIALSLINGSADIERGFSKSKRIMPEDRTSMSIRTLNAKLTVHDALKQYQNRPELVPINKKLLTLGSAASKSYKHHLEQERLRKEAAEKKIKEEEGRKAVEEKKMKELSYNKKDIDKFKEELKIAKKKENTQVEASEKLLQEANRRLKKALDKGDYTEAKLAQTMIEGVVKSKEDCRDSRKTIDSIEKKIEKRKDSIITSFFTKKPRMN